MGQLLAALLVAGAASMTTDWPSFLGPQKNGQATAAPEDVTWTASPAEAWSVPTGPGFGGPAVRDGEVFLLDREVGEADILRCLDLHTGQEKWRSSNEAPGRLQFQGSRTVPAVEEDLVYACGGFGHVYCFDRESQELAWSISMQDEYQGVMPMFGWSASPVIYEDLVIVTPLGPEVGLVALERFTGEEVWRTAGVGHSHSTPALLEFFGQTQVVFISTGRPASGQDQAAESSVWGFDVEDGSQLWEFKTLLTRLPIPPPLKIDAERMFLTAGYRAGSKMIHMRQEDGEYRLEEGFRIDRGAQIHAPLLHEDHLYVLVNENWNDPRNNRKEGGLLCLSLDGEEKWRTGDEPFFGRGSAIMLDGHLLIQDGHSGILRVIRPNPDKYEPVAETNVFAIEDVRDHQMWAPMAFSQGYLLLRSQDELKALRLSVQG